jgi:hypothetical protein
MVRTAAPAGTLSTYRREFQEFSQPTVCLTEQGRAEVGGRRGDPFCVALAQDTTPANDRCARGTGRRVDTHRLDGVRMTHDNDGQVKGRRGIRRLADTCALPNPLGRRPGL